MSNTPISNEPVATGSRREERRYDPSDDQVVKVRHTFAPDGAVPPQEHSAASEDGVRGSVPGVTDVQITPEGPSVWDARPTDDEEDEAGR